MRIGLFVLMAGREAGGPETYEVELIRALARIDTRNEYIVYCTGEEAPAAINVRQDNVSYRVLRPSRRWLSVPFTLPAVVASDRVDVLHSTFTPPPFSPVRQMLTVHCVSSFVHPEYYSPLVAWRLNSLLKIGMRTARCVLCVSHTTLADVHRLFRVPLDRLAVAYNGVGAEFRPTPPDAARKLVRERLGIDYPYLLFLGKLEPRKNVMRLIEAYARYRQDTGSDARLLLAGHRTAVTPEIQDLVKRLNLGAHVVQPGYVSKTDLPLLYSGARMFLFPSLWEGFGIPMIEAMACGTPVLTSNVSCLPEVAGDAAVIVDPWKVDSIAEGMARIDASDTTEMVRRGFERARQFTWESSARSTLAAYARYAAS
jgi:glycosyltransferase involved in cell wall biosynthesis